MGFGLREWLVNFLGDYWYLLLNGVGIIVMD